MDKVSNFRFLFFAVSRGEMTSIAFKIRARCARTQNKIIDVWERLGAPHARRETVRLCERKRADWGCTFSIGKLCTFRGQICKLCTFSSTLHVFCGNLGTHSIVLRTVHHNISEVIRRARARARAARARERASRAGGARAAFWQREHAENHALVTRVWGSAFRG